MIKSLHISNYALLKEVIIYFQDGFTVVSGETGAGKSIMLDALSLLLGKRVERFSTNKNTPKSSIEGVFQLDKSHQYFFEKNDLDFEVETIIRREVNAKGKNRAFINDTPVLLSTLTAFGKQLIEIHAQHQSIVLKEETVQFQLIDHLAKSDNEFKDYSATFNNYNELKKELQVITNKGSLSAVELEFLQFQFNELYDANLIKEEKEELEGKIILLEHIDGIAIAISESEQLLNNEQGIVASLSTIKRKLLDFKHLVPLSERVESVLIELNDISAEFSAINNTLIANPQELLKLNNRLDLLNNLLQKHRKSFIEELIALRDEMKEHMQLSASFEQLVKQKESVIAVQLVQLGKAAAVLNSKRDQVLPKAKNDIERLLKKLGMPYAQFEIVFAVSETFHSNGNTNIQFRFSANKGTVVQEISKIASGGELSRLTLAIKYISAQVSKVNTLIFDEIDSGVSGEIASLMGEMMQEISQNNQLIAISHLPQIASKANTHLKVVKSVVKEETISSVVQLNNEQRIDEIAKLLSGKKVTQAAFDNAVELLNQ